MNLKCKSGTYVIEYKQALLNEMIEYFQKKDHSAVWLHEFLVKHTVRVDNQRWWSFRKTISKSEYLSLGEEKIHQIMKRVEETYLFIPKTRKTDEEEKKAPFESSVMFFAEKNSRDALYILENYTFEQVILYSRGIEFNLNQQTPEGRVRNDMLLAWEEMGDPDDDLETIKKLRQHYDK